MAPSTHYADGLTVPLNMVPNPKLNGGGDAELGKSEATTDKPCIQRVTALNVEKIVTFDKVLHVHVDNHYSISTQFTSKERNGGGGGGGGN